MIFKSRSYLVRISRYRVVLVGSCSLNIHQSIEYHMVDQLVDIHMNHRLIRKIHQLIRKMRPVWCRLLWHNQNWRWLLVRSLQQVLLERCKLMQLVLLVLVQHNYRKMSHWRVVRSNLLENQNEISFHLIFVDIYP